MKIISFALKTAALAVALNIATVGQTSNPQPRQEKLLNGLKVLMWPDASAKNVTVRVRVHSGSAFDPQGKEGVLKLLAENIFPNEAARDYFRDDLGGSLEIVTSYDYIQIIASGRSDSFLQMLETVATAVANPTIDKETTARLKTDLLANVEKLGSDPKYVAERAAAKHLLGTFPYGRPQFGTRESIAKIDFADLIEAKQRFFTADNATLSVTGNFDRSSGFRAIRRFFGAWLKSDKRVPLTFRQPEPPAPVSLLVPSPRQDMSALVYAARGPARRDNDLAPAHVLANVLAARLRSRIPVGKASEIFVRVEEQSLPGVFFIGFLEPQSGTDDEKANFRDIIQGAIAEPVSDAEFAAAKGLFAAEWKARDVTAFWLDADTYGLTSVERDMRSADTVTLPDVAAYAAKLRSLPMVAVLARQRPAN
jgi:zinc protease